MLATGVQKGVVYEEAVAVRGVGTSRVERPIRATRRRR